MNNQMVAGFFCQIISFYLMAAQVRGGGGGSFLSTPPDFHCSSTFLQEPLKGLSRLGEFQRGKVVDSFTEYILTEHLLCARNCIRHWGYRNEPSKASTPVDLIFY